VLDALLDASIYWSFDASGYRRHERRFRPEDLALDLGGRSYLITGANGGLGLETARSLAARGADVYMACRDPERGREAARRVREQTRGANVHLVELDVSSLSDVRRFATGFAPARLDALVHNAGLIPAQRQLTRDGIELALATHVVGPFLLSRLLEAKLVAVRPGRVIWVSSGGMYTARLSLADVDWARRPYSGVAAYAQTKRMQVVLSELLSARWEDRGIVSHAMHPGWAQTGGLESSLPGFTRFMAGRLRSPAQGADTIAWLCAAQEPARSSGRFWFDRRAVRAHVLPFQRESATERAALWELCERAAGPFEPQA
jgi:NAD(P)-dependent dehydrogenase (short-subunit alcohol dehydrogenase family)